MKYGAGHTIYFLGIGGIGMSALARYYQHQGATIFGYDLTPSPLTRQLENEGMAIHYEDNLNSLPSLINVVIYTPAIPSTLKEFQELRRRGIPMLKRAQALGQLSEHDFTIAISGTHGKTTTTAMVSHILHENKVNFTAFIGGIANNFNSNLHLGDGKENILVVEADEFDHSFLQLQPNISVVTSVDADHLDIYGDMQHLVASFNEFAAKTDSKGAVICREDLPIATNKKQYSFGFGEKCDFSASEISTQGLQTQFMLHLPDGRNTKVQIPMVGRHNILNAMAAFAATLQMNLDPADIARALESFKGVKRRFDIRVFNDKFCYIDDYAHHPVEIRSCLTAVREAFPDKKVTVVFQPHLFSRTRDFMQEFANSLSLADELILLDIYPAREKPIEGITSNALAEKVSIAKKSVCSKDQLMATIKALQPEVLVTMGAGDIDRFVQPLEKEIQSW